MNVFQLYVNDYVTPVFCDAKADLCSSSEIILELQRIFCEVSFAILSYNCIFFLVF